MKNIPIAKSCSIVDYARSSYYKSIKQVNEVHAFENQLLQRIRDIRTSLPNLGGRKVHYLLDKEDFHVGRDRLFTLLRDHNLLIKRKKRDAVTTNSNHPFKVYTNLLKEQVITRVNQVWVSDITYLRINERFCYLSLITDLYSRKIVGYHVNDTLELEGTLHALRKALTLATPEIHHSDRGSQYCSYKYTNELKKRNIKISMTQENHCYENAIAERINGILKQEFNLNTNFKNIYDAKKAAYQAIQNYNLTRPHWRLNLKTPEAVYLAA